MAIATQPQAVTILGATGSIGQSTLDVIGRHPDRFRVEALAARSNWEQLRELCLQFHPRQVALTDVQAARRLREALVNDACPVEVLDGADAVAELAGSEDTDVVVAGIVGSAGLLPTLCAAKAGKRVLLANKEALVLAGGLFMDAVAAAGATLLPVDSEHNAVFQCLPQGARRGHLRDAGITRVLLTASGGPFRTMPMEKMERVTPDQACAHPNWEMGRKISVDSATLMNKGLELIEAQWLFGLEPDALDVAVHPQSIVHSLVEYVDGSVLAQMGNPDMRTPIAHALAWPDRLDAGVRRLNLFDVRSLDFEPPDQFRFPCLGLARRVMSEGGTAGAVLNAANEVAVEAFLAGRVRFTAIAPIVEEALTRFPVETVRELDQLIELDAKVRVAVHDIAKAATWRS